MRFTTKEVTGRAFVAAAFLFVYFAQTFRLQKSALASPKLGARGLRQVDPPSLLQIDIKRTQQYVHDRMQNYNNKADFAAAVRLFRIVKSLDLDRKESIVLVGGSNNGNLASEILQVCQNISFYGFEIQKNHLRNAQKLLKSYAHATFLNLGWDEYEREGVAIGGKGAAGGLFDPRGQRGFSMQSETATTVSLSEWTTKESIKQVLYVVIDTEGHEPKVIRGMQLSRIEMQKRFPLFQFELGGTWAKRDARHQNDQWSQRDAVRYLEECGYKLFLIGNDDWLSITADFFNEIDNPVMKNEGFGKFVQGNVLAMHSRFVPGRLEAQIRRHVLTIGNMGSIEAIQ